MNRLLNNPPALFAIALVCAALFLVVLPALPDDTADGAQFVGATAVALTGLAALGLGVRAWSRSRR